MPAAFMETLIQSLSDFILGFLYRARNHLTRIASYLRKMMTKPCIKIHVKSDSAIESAFPYILSYLAFPVVGPMPRGLQCGIKRTAFYCFFRAAPRLLKLLRPQSLENRSSPSAVSTKFPFPSFLSLLDCAKIK